MPHGHASNRIRSGYKINSFYCLPQVPAVEELLATTAVFSRSFIAADDTTAVQELTPDGSGAASLQIMMWINCMVGVEDEVRTCLEIVLSSLKLIICNLKKSSPILVILVSFCFIIISLMFFPSRLTIILDPLRFELNFLNRTKNLKMSAWSFLYPTQSFPVLAILVSFWFIIISDIFLY